MKMIVLNIQKLVLCDVIEMKKQNNDQRCEKVQYDWVQKVWEKQQWWPRVVIESYVTRCESRRNCNPTTFHIKLAGGFKVQCCKVGEWWKCSYMFNVIC
jgi:hypothetical protein